ncbi:hypothetical protein [Spirosoma foliorum]|uniref:Uncharacterized protein n=1 Tax=Spirosoma foliorum TaxID=2710596 RepID=A0A7G5GNA2_9BACT|nr:hypothetical protein [Spirosoma foliorum]QMW00344.1 hypothetical protein H3H32_20235 [Spirosoma foliorum]
METSAKALQLILFTDEGTLLEDSLSYHPDYRVGDIIHLFRPSDSPVASSNDHQYVITSVKHVISTSAAFTDGRCFFLLVGVVKLVDQQRDELSRSMQDRVKSK